MNKKYEFYVKYKEFCLAEGSQHIASEYAIESLSNLVQKFQIKSILEVGLGIGSISGILLSQHSKNPGLEYTGTENNEFCLNELPKNLKEDYSLLRIYSDLNKIPSDKKFDLIIIDGKDEKLQAIKGLISHNGILAIEGDRLPQLESLRVLFPDHNYVHLISNKKNKSYSPFSPTHWQGGLKIIFINPTNFQKLWWVKEKISTKLKYCMFR